jgi:carboxyl-terminal processing protease
MFLNKGDIIYKKTDGKNIDDIVSETDKEIDMPVVLLVNGLTASSSEVFVSSLKENLNVSVVGTNTYGKGMIQKLVELSNGKYIKFSVQEWLTASGNKIEGVGIIPDVYILPDEQSEYDIQLEKAVDIAKEK